MNKRILFFDDEPYLSNYLIKNLKSNFGWNITSVSSVSALLDEINNLDANYSLFILDIMSPLSLDEKNMLSEDEVIRCENGMSTGLLMAEKIWSKTRYTNTPILFLSARTTPLPIGKKTAYLRKPMSAQIISNKMDELLQQN